jgi:hypothetical protein
MMFLMRLSLPWGRQLVFLPMKAIGLEVIHDTGHG